MRDLGAADRLQRLAVGAPQRSLRGPYRRLEQKRVRHGCIMARTAPFRVRCDPATAKGALMLTERIWSGNSLRNFHYLIACAETGEALAVDPLEWRLCLEAARKRGWEITQILNTHEHVDHTGGNAGLKAATHAPVLAHPAGAHAGAGAVLRRHAVQRGRRQLFQRRGPGKAVRHFRDAARAPAG